MYVIGKINGSDYKYLYKDHLGRYLFSDFGNVRFNSELEATNFIYYNSSMISHLINDGDKLIALPTPVTWNESIQPISSIWEVIK